MWQLSIEEKKNAVKRCFERGESVKSVSKELGCSRNGRDLLLVFYVIMNLGLNMIKNCMGIQKISKVLG